ncbi:MAG: GAF domain-containing protein [Proteobacteria bacterium]|nr:GAF domain-containing protein [Pseudomonadota bacterium]
MDAQVETADTQKSVGHDVPYATVNGLESLSEAELRKQVEKLNQIGIALSSEINLERLLEVIVHEARTFTGADAGSLYILDCGTLYFHVTQNDTLRGRSHSLPDFKPYPLPLSEESIAGYVGCTAQILNIENVYNLPKTVPYHFNPDFDLRNDYVTRSMLVVPMRDQGEEILGVLQLINAMDKAGAVVPFRKSVEDLVMSLASQAAVAIRNAKLISDIKAVFESLIRYSISAIDARSPHTAGHSKRVANHCQAIARAINNETAGPFRDISFTTEQMEELIYAAWLHDIGKIGVPERILDKGHKLSDETMATIATRFELIKAVSAVPVGKHSSVENRNKLSGDTIEKQVEIERKEIEKDFVFVKKVNRSQSLSGQDVTTVRAIGSKTYKDLEGNVRPFLTDQEIESLSVRKGSLTEKEYMKVQTHVEHTYNIVKNVPFTKSLKNVPLFAGSHHEFLDGTGYPRGLKSDELPLQSRILAVADIFDALTALDRPYRSAMPVSKACKILKAHAKAGRLDQDVVNLFIDKELYK